MDPIQRCASCSTEIALSDSRTTCPGCGGLLEIIYSHVLDASALRRQFAARLSVAGWQRSGVWRYSELLPPMAPQHIVTYPEGNTPLLSRDKIAAWSGARNILLKHEGLNPTGSFKDRGMSVAISQAKRVGAASVACASTGNTSSSLAAYAGIAGISALVFAPAGHVAQGKLAQTIAYGARTLLVRGDFDACLRLVREASEKLGIYLVNSVNAFRIEGQKTIVLELLQQLDWKAPDWIALPAGNLGNAAAFGKAIREAHEWGLIDKVPRLLLVQAEGAAPFAKSFSEGFRKRHIVRPETIATAIRIGDPASYDRAVRTILETDGIVIASSDSEIMEAKSIVDSCGVGCEPASAASVAGVRRLVADGTIAPDAQVVAVLTGHVLKDPVSSGHDPIEIEPTLDAVEKVLSGLR